MRCVLFGEGSHQLESCPNLSVAKKIEVLVERFDAQGISLTNKAHNLFISTPPLLVHR